MVQINLNEFQTYLWAELLEFMRLQEGYEFNISLSKKTIAGTDCDFNVFWEYYHAAYIGQELSRISTHFSYTVPCAKKVGQFSFRVVADDKYLLALGLFYLINGFYTQKDALLFDQYTAAAEKLLQDACNGKDDTACWGLVWLANAFLKKS